MDDIGIEHGGRGSIIAFLSDEMNLVDEKGSVRVPAWPQKIISVTASNLPFMIHDVFNFPTIFPEIYTQSP